MVANVIGGNTPLSVQAFRPVSAGQKAPESEELDRSPETE